MFGFGPLYLDLGHFAYIWATLLGFGLFGTIWVRIGPKGDEALRMRQGGMDGHTDVHIDRFALHSTRLYPLWDRRPKKKEKGKKKNKQQKKFKR